MPKFTMVGALSREVERKKRVLDSKRCRITFDPYVFRVLGEKGFTELRGRWFFDGEIPQEGAPVAVRATGGGWFYPDHIIQSGLGETSLCSWFVLAKIPGPDGILYAGIDDYRIIIEGREVAQVRLWGRKDFMDPDPVIELPNKQWELLNEGRNSLMFYTARDVFNHVKNMESKGLL